MTQATRAVPIGGDVAQGRPRFAWIYGARTDLAVGLCWIPVFLVVHALVLRHGVANDHLLNDLFNGAFVLSLLHQPLTLALVYGDRNQFELRRRLFTWSPVVAIGLISVAVLLDLWIIIPVAAIWNVIHTLQQRYGVLPQRLLSGRLDDDVWLELWQPQRVGLPLAAALPSNLLEPRLRLRNVRHPDQRGLARLAAVDGLRKVAPDGPYANDRHP